MQSRLLVLAAALAALTFSSSATAATTSLSGRVVDRPAVKHGEVRVPVVITSPGPVRLATLSVPRAALRHPANLRLGDRVRGRNHRWLRVSHRAAGPTFARLDALVSGALAAGEKAATDLRRFSQLPPSPLAGPSAVTATRDEADQLRVRLNLLDARLAALDPGLAGAVAAVQAAYAGAPARFRTLRRARDARVAGLDAARTAGTKTRKAIADATYVIDKRLSEVPSNGIEIPISPVSTVSEVTSLLIKTLNQLP